MKVSAHYVAARQCIKIAGHAELVIQPFDVVLLNGVRMRVLEVSPFDIEVDAAPAIINHTSLAHYAKEPNVVFTAFLVSISTTGPAFGGLIIGRPDMTVLARVCNDSDRNGTLCIEIPAAAIPHSKRDQFFVIDGALLVRADDMRHEKRRKGKESVCCLRIPRNRLANTHMQVDHGSRTLHINIEFAASKETLLMGYSDPFERVLQTTDSLVDVLLNEARTAIRAAFQSATAAAASLDAMPAGGVIVSPSGLVKAVLYSADGRVVDKLDALPEQAPSSADDTLYLSVLPSDAATDAALASLLDKKRLFKQILFIERVGVAPGGVAPPEPPRGLGKIHLDAGARQKFEELYRVYLGACERPYVTHVTFCDMTDAAVVHPHRRYQAANVLFQDVVLGEKIDELNEFVDGMLVLDTESGTVNYTSVLEGKAHRRVAGALMTTRLGAQVQLAPPRDTATPPPPSPSPPPYTDGMTNGAAFTQWLRQLREAYAIRHVLFFGQGFPSVLTDECVDERIRLITTGDTRETPLFSMTTDLGVVVASRYRPESVPRSDGSDALFLARHTLTERDFLATPVDAPHFDDRILWMAAPAARLFLVVPSSSPLLEEQTVFFSVRQSGDLVARIRQLVAGTGEGEDGPESDANYVLHVVHADHPRFAGLCGAVGLDHGPLLVASFDPTLFAADVYTRGLTKVAF